VSRLPVVAIINTNPDLVELLKVRIEAAGLVTLVIHIADIRAGLDLGAVLAQHQLIGGSERTRPTPGCRDQRDR